MIRALAWLLLASGVVLLLTDSWWALFATMLSAVAMVAKLIHLLFYRGGP
jgi:hypothetical protein